MTDFKISYTHSYKVYEAQQLSVCPSYIHTICVCPQSLQQLFASLEPQHQRPARLILALHLS